MGNLASTQLNTQSDPALVLQQALQRREQQYSSIQNPQQQLAARLGGLLGGGLVNLSQDRGFFDINDPLLTKVTQIQGVYNDVASRVDPATDPAKFYTELQAAYSEAGLGREALAAAQEAQKAKVSGMDAQIKEAQLYKTSPELLAGKIEDALKAGKDDEAMRLANLKTRIDQDRELDVLAKKTDISAKQAEIEYKKAVSENGKYKVMWSDQYNSYVRTDKEGNVSLAPITEEMKQKLAPTKDTKGKPEGKLDKSKYMVGGDTASTTASPSNNAATFLSQDEANKLIRNQPQAKPQPTNWAARLQEMNNVLPTVPTPQERDFALQRAYPTFNISLMDENQKAVLAQQLGL